MAESPEMPPLPLAADRPTFLRAMLERLEVLVLWSAEHGQATALTRLMAQQLAIRTELDRLVEDEPSTEDATIIGAVRRARRRAEASESWTAVRSLLEFERELQAEAQAEAQAEDDRRMASQSIEDLERQIRELESKTRPVRRR